MSLFSKKSKIEEKKVVKAAEKTLPAGRQAREKTASKIHAGASNVKTVLKQPWFSERATILAAKGQYIFLVTPDATKPAVRSEIQRRYGVHVTGVNMVVLKGKMKHFGAKMSRRNSIKKAIVTLKPGDKIEIQ